MATIILLRMPSPLICSYFSFGVVVAIGIAATFLRCGSNKARGLDLLILLGPILYAAPLAAFGTEHFTVTDAVASLVPKWIPWHYFWVYLVGACFIAAALSLVTNIQVRLSTGLLALTFFLFVMLMDLPGWVRHPRDRFALAFVLRELSFGAGPLAIAALGDRWQRGVRILAIVARYFIAIALMFYAFEQFVHGDHVPGVPLEMVTPGWVFGHAVWTYLTAVLSAIAGCFLLIDKNTRAAAAWLGLTLVFVVVVVYVPIAAVEHSNLEGFNYMADTLMFAGTILLLARAMPQRSALPALSSKAESCVTAG